MHRNELKIVKLEITGETMYLTNGEFEELKKRIGGNSPFYSIHRICGYFCEAYVK